jgi:multidrug resistance efflux pump
MIWLDIQSKIYIEKSEIWAPIISLAPKNIGEIDDIYVKEGDTVMDGQNLIKVGGQIITAKTSGIITWVGNTPGQLANSQTVVIKMIDPQRLRVVGHIQEDKGLSDIRIGQKVIFTVDAFGSKQYYGTIETIGTSARQSSVVFSISDKREEQEFDITASFDVNAYPELKNGMSAKMWVIK